MQQHVNDSSTTIDIHSQPHHHSTDTIYSRTTAMPPAPSDPEGSIALEETGNLGITGGSSSVSKISNDKTKHDTASRSSVLRHRRVTSTPTTSYASTLDTLMLACSTNQEVSPDKSDLSSSHGGDRQKTQSSKQTVVSASQQPEQTSSHFDILSSHLPSSSHQYTTSSGGVVLQTLPGPSHYEKLSVIGNGK